ncbi:MAG: DUF1428 domain-containing protein [Bdellovibrionota bacterium]
MTKKYNYVDGFVVPVPRKNLLAYKKMAKSMGKLWVKYGAIDYVECVADDVKSGKVTSFPQAVKLKKGEVVFFSWATYKSKAQRDRVMKKVMADPVVKKSMESGKMPFDGMRMFWGGFKPAVKL